MLDAIKPLVEQYKFVKVPQGLEDWDDSKGITFRHGKFHSKGKDVVIDSFQVFNNGLMVDTRQDNEEAERFIDDVIEWGVKTYGLAIPEDQLIEKIYLSNLEVTLDKPLSDHVPVSKRLGTEISRYLTEYGIKHEPYEATGYALNFDKMSLPNSVLANFSLQRREGIPFSSGIYFSSAPLKTQDHIALLKTLDS